MAALKAGNLALAFLLELFALGASAYWGFHTGNGIVQVILGVGTPLLLAVIWGLFLAPRSSKRVKGLLLPALQLTIFWLAALGLASVGQQSVAIAYAAVALISVVLGTIWKQENAALE